jgi:SAM-dependent methyltransferase
MVDPVQDFYANYYDKIFNPDISGLSNMASRITHSRLERNFQDNKFNFPKVLEIGAGKGEHFNYVKHRFTEYIHLDLFEEPENFPAKGNSSSKWVAGNVEENLFASESFDRVISMCVLHHLQNPRIALENIKLWLKPEGTFSLFLPSDPGFLNRLNRKVLLEKKVRKSGFKHYGIVNAREHRNHYWGLLQELQNTFEGYSCSRRYYPVNIPIADLSLFSVWHFKKPV